MATKDQIAANRRNAQLSTGPRTPKDQYTKVWRTLQRAAAAFVPLYGI